MLRALKPTTLWTCEPHWTCFLLACYSGPMPDGCRLGSTLELPRASQKVRHLVLKLAPTSIVELQVSFMLGKEAVGLEHRLGR